MISTLFTPIRATATPAGTITGGSSVTIETNVPATVLYTLDGSEPRLNVEGTFRADAPVSIELRVSARLRFKAIDSRLGRANNQTKTREVRYVVTRNNPAEALRDTSHFYRRLLRSVVDSNFYLTAGRWLLPSSNRSYTYAYVNRESYPVRLRALHNGVDVFTTFPIVGINELKEIPIRPTSGENFIQIQTNRGGSTALYDIGRYDIDTYE